MNKELLKNKLSDIRIEVNEEEWTRFNLVLKRRMFFRFHFNTFNIYYLFSGLVFFGLYSYVLLNFNKTPDFVVKELKQVDTFYVKEEIPLVHNTKQPYIKKQKDTLKINSSESNKVSINDKKNETFNVSLNSSVSKRDSLLKELENNVPQPKKKRIRYVTQRDTIYQIDTSFVKGKK